jgi:C1A family cysteine protease
VRDIYRYRCDIVRDEHDSRDFISKTVWSDLLPAKVDYSEYVTVKNQGALGSCGSHAAVSGLEMLHKLENFRWPVPLSELFHYYMVRQKEYMNTFPLDTGQNGRNAMKVLNQVGVCPEKLMPYDDSKGASRPSLFAQGFSAFWGVKSYERCYSVEGIMSALATRKAVWLGVPVQAAIRKNKGELITFKPGVDLVGGHAMLVLGYDDAKRCLKVLNSWSDSWGEDGFGYLGYEYLSLAPWFDAWAFSKA